MNEKILKEIFDLMYKKLVQLAIGDGFFKWIDKVRKVNFEKERKKGDNYLFEKLASSIFVSGFRSQIIEKKWPFIKKAFNNFDINKIATYNKKKTYLLFKDKRIIRHQGKIRAIIKNAKRISCLQKQYGSFANYLISYKKDLSKLAQDLIERFDFLGKATVWDFLKTIGFDAIKPDVHVRRFFCRLIKGKDNLLSIKEVFEVARDISRATNEPLRVIDAVIWFYCADRPKEIRKPICGKKPLCDECVITKFCKYYHKAKQKGEKLIEK